jgi:hypothetical protein
MFYHSTFVQHFYILPGELTGGILIQQEINDDVENSSVSFRCMLHNTNVSIVSWIPQGLGYICIYNQTCGNVLSNLKNWRYTCRCQNIKQDTLSVELQIHNITEKDHNTNMTCEATLTSKFLSASALLLVKGECNTQSMFVVNCVAFRCVIHSFFNISFIVLLLFFFLHYIL